ERVREVSLHVMDQQCNARASRAPGHTRGRQLGSHRKCVVRNSGNGHRYLLLAAAGASGAAPPLENCSRSAARSCLRLTLPTPVVGKALTNTTWSGILEAASPRVLIQPRIAAARRAGSRGTTTAHDFSPR